MKPLIVKSSTLFYPIFFHQMLFSVFICNYIKKIQKQTPECRCFSNKIRKSNTVQLTLYLSMINVK